MTIKLKVPKVILKIRCSQCSQEDLVRYKQGSSHKQLECFCGSTRFEAFHTKGEEIEAVRKKIKSIKSKDYESFEDISNSLGKDFNEIFN